MSSHSAFYQIHLDRVSRSFAFCIRQMSEPLRAWIGLSYLLCRVVDTIEDSAWATETEQLQAFAAFDAALTDAQNVAAFHAWAVTFSNQLNVEGERRLFQETERLLNDFHNLPPQVVEIIRELILTMSHGMQHFCRQRHGGALRLKTLAEVNQYCFFVAGVVGELLAKLVAKVEPKFRLSQISLLRAHHFGLFLQKVNLLKDQVGDEQVGRHLIPSRDLVERSSYENARGALDFLLELPQEQMEFRRFCAWSLFLGLEALRVAKDSILKQQVLKIPRAEAERLLMKVEAGLGDNSSLRLLFENLSRPLGWSDERIDEGEMPPRAVFPDWFLKVYRGLLEPQSLLLLGLESSN